MPTLNPFTNIQLNVAGEVVTVQFSVDPLFGGSTPYSFDLLAYEDEGFKEPLYTIHTTDFYAIDDTKTRQNMLPSFFYKLRLNTSDNKQFLSDFFGWHPSDSVTRHHYLLASDISRRERIRFNYAGIFAYLLKRRAYSPNLPCDVDPVTGEPIIDNTASFGVGTLGGYYSPVLTRVSIESRVLSQNLDSEGRGAQFAELLSVRSAGFPFIDQHDIIVTPDSKRFTVTDPVNKYFPGTTLIIIQKPNLRLVPNTDTVYSIPVPPFPHE